jgi:hypothetical protein
MRMVQKTLLQDKSYNPQHMDATKDQSVDT